MTGKDLGLKAVRGKLLDVKEVASLLNVSERWVQDRMHEGKFPIRWFPIGPHCRFVDSADLDDWLKRVCVETQLPVAYKRAKKNKKVS